MAPVEIHPFHDSLVLRAKGSELLILPHHVRALKERTVPKDFSGYFMSDALINRPARKLFEAWLRKDAGLWGRIYRAVQGMELSAEEAENVPEEKPAAPVAAKPVVEEEPKAPTRKKAAKVTKTVAKEKAPKAEKTTRSKAVSEKDDAAKPAKKRTTKKKGD